MDKLQEYELIVAAFTKRQSLLQTIAGDYFSSPELSDLNEQLFDALCNLLKALSKEKSRLKHEIDTDIDSCNKGK